MKTVSRKIQASRIAREIEKRMAERRDVLASAIVAEMMLKSPEIARAAWLAGKVDV